MAKKTFEWIGHVLAGLIVLYTIYYGTKVDLLGVSFLLGLCYLGRTYRTTSQASIYNTVFLLSLSYLLLVERLLGINVLALCWFVPFLIIQGFCPDPLHLARFFEKAPSSEEEGSREYEEAVDFVTPLAISTRIVTASLIGYLVWNQAASGNVFLLVIPLVLLALYELRLLLHYQNSWYSHRSIQED